MQRDALATQFIFKINIPKRPVTLGESFHRSPACMIQERICHNDRAGKRPAVMTPVIPELAGL